MKKYLFIVYHHCALWQVALLQKFLHDKQWEFDVVSVDGKQVVTDGGLALHVDHGIEVINGEEYEFVLLPGVDLTPEIIENEALKAFLINYHGLIAASCASSVLVAAAGLVKGNFTSLPHIVDHFSDFYKEGVFQDTDVCVEEKLITSKGFAHFDFMMAVLKALGLTEEDPRLGRIGLKLSKNQ